MENLPTRENEKGYYYKPSQGDKIICNAAFCSHCNVEITSSESMNFTACKCKNVMIRGAKDEILHLWINNKFYKRRCVTQTKEQKNTETGNVLKIESFLNKAGILNEKN